MKRNIDTILKHALSPEEEPDQRLNDRILREAKEMTHMAGWKRGRIPAAIVAAAFTLMIGSTAVFAAWKYLSPAQLAQEGEDDTLSEAFSGEDALLINEAQEYGGYRATLLGVVSGKGLSDYLELDEDELESGKTYIAVAVEHADGSPMRDTSDDDYGEESFFVSPYIKGLDPHWYNILFMGGGYTGHVRGGIEYRILDTANVEIFADRGIYVGVSDGTFYNNQAYLFDEDTGEITRNEDYDGLNALFELPVDPSKAEPQAADELIKRMESGGETEETDVEDKYPEEVSDAAAWAKQCEQAMADGTLEQYARVIPGTEQTCTPDENGMISYRWEQGKGSTGSSTYRVDWLFKDSVPGTSVSLGWQSSGGGLESTIIEVGTLNEDGTVTCAVYEPVLDE